MRTIGFQSKLATNLLLVALLLFYSQIGLGAEKEKKDKPAQVQPEDITIVDGYDYSVNNGATKQEVNDIFKQGIIQAREVRRETIDSALEGGYVEMVHYANDEFKLAKDLTKDARKEALEELKKDQGEEPPVEEPPVQEPPPITPTPEPIPSPEPSPIQPTPTPTPEPSPIEPEPQPSLEEPTPTQPTSPTTQPEPTPTEPVVSVPTSIPESDSSLRSGSGRIFKKAKEVLNDTADVLVTTYYSYAPPGLQDALENPTQIPAYLTDFLASAAPLANAGGVSSLPQSNCPLPERIVSQIIIQPGCILNLGDNPTTDYDIYNFGSLVVGSGTWSVLGAYTQNFGANLTMSGETIDLASGELVINNTDVSSNDLSKSEASELTLAVHNQTQQNSFINCTNLTLSKVKVILPEGGINVTSNCNFEKDKSAFPAPTLAILAIPYTFFPAIRNLLQAGLGVGDLWNLVSRAFSNLLSAFGLKRKRKYWGTVYDSVTKQPLDPVIIKLIEPDNGKVVEQVISDLYGHFGFLVRKGKFLLTAEKGGYAFPSIKSLGKEDEIYDHLYHGEIVEIKSKSDVITPNIPMDRLQYDFNQEAKKKIIHFHPWFSWSVYIIMTSLFWTGFLAAIFNFLVVHSIYNLVILGIYLLLVIYKLVWPTKRVWGIVRKAKTGKPVADLVLELNYPTIAEVLVGRAKTAIDGKYFLKAQPGKYILKIKKLGQAEVLLTKNIVIKKNAVLTEEIKI